MMFRHNFQLLSASSHVLSKVTGFTMTGIVDVLFDPRPTIDCLEIGDLKFV